MAARHRRGRLGGIVELLELVERYPEELTYDWMTRIHLPLAALTDGRIGWLEGYLVTRAILRDPTSRTHAAMADWKYPMSRTEMILADLVDATIALGTDKKHKSKVKPYPRPWPHGNTRKSTPPKAPQAAVRAALAARGHALK